MAALPDYVLMRWAGYGEPIDPSVRETPFERGPSRLEILNSRVRHAVACTLVFRSSADATAFQHWWRTAIGRVGWFDVVHPRTGQQLAMRFKGGAIGPLTPSGKSFGWMECAVELEWYA